MTRSRGISSRFGYRLVGIIVLFLALWARLTNLYSLPVFVDEGTHILWAQSFARGLSNYPLWMDGRMLLGVLLAQFQLIGPAPLWVSRAAVAALTLISVAASFALGTYLGGRRVGLLAGLIYALLPYALFHDRQALADPLASAFGSLAIVLALRLARTRRLWLAAPLALCLAAAILFKLTSAPYLAILILAPLILAASRAKRRTLTLHALAALGLTLLLLAAFAIILSPRLGQSAGILTEQQLSFVACPPLLCRGDVAEQLRRLPGVIGGLLQLIAPYFGWPLVVLTLFAGFAPHHRPVANRRVILFLCLTLLVMLLAVIATATRELPPRYFGLLAAPLAALAALGLAQIGRYLIPRPPLPTRPPVALQAHKSSRRERGWPEAGGEAASGATYTLARLMGGAAVAALFIFPFTNSLAIIAHPEKARLTEMDRYQYFTGPYAGIGFRESALALQTRETDPQRPPLILVRTFIFHSIGAYLDPTRTQVMAATDAVWADVSGALASGRSVYVVDAVPSVSEATANSQLDQTANLIAAFARADNAVRVRRFGEAEPSALRQLFAALFPRPDAFINEYNQILADSQPGPDQTELIAPYPTHQLEFLDERLRQHPGRVELVDIGGAQPWDIAAAISSLEQSVPPDAAMKVIFLDEGRLDPRREVETWLNTHFFPASEQWYGPLRVVEFLGAGTVAQTIEADARFGESIALEAVDVFDSTARPGGAVRLRLVWRAAQPVGQALKVFVHVFAETGIVAQHDGQPVGELRPTTTWQAGEEIYDQLAVRLPDGAAPGAYQLRIGLYDPNTQARAPVRLADGSAAEFWVGGAITVR